MGFKLPEILQRISLDRVQHHIHIYFPASGEKFFENIRGVSSFYDQAIIEPYPVVDDGTIFQDESLIITTKRFDHTVDTFGYRIQEKDSVNLVKGRLDALGISGPLAGQLKQMGEIACNDETVRLEDVSNVRQGQSFAFVMDTRMCDNAVSLAQDVDLLVTESTFLSQDEDAALKYGHLTAAQAATIAKEARAGMLLLTHFSQRYGMTTDFTFEAAAIHPDVIQLNDKDTYQLLRTGIVRKEE